MNLWFFIFTVGVISVLFSFYVNKPSLNSKKKILFSILIFSFTTLTYIVNSNLKVFSFKENLENDLYKEKNINPEKLILFLEIQLKEDPNDLEGWKILARTCLLSGYVQKADIHYKRSLKFFPNNLDLLSEYADLKENLAEFSNAILLREKIKELDNSNSENLISLIQLYLGVGKKDKAKIEIESLKNKKINREVIKDLNSKINY
tara:strand:- start:718 stop:1332 length:615 start_codon:yes stop_codon:yes gene_type:complete